MGLDATVMCNCFRDLKTTPPPFPRAWLEIDGEGYLNLKPEHDSDENWAKQRAWQQSCCQHASLNFAAEHISNWTGYRQLQAALGAVGWPKFPTLKEQLPNANGGLTPSAASAQALVELDAFASAADIGTKTVLVDTASGEGLYEYVAAYDGVFILSGSRGINIGLSESEFFAADATTGEDLFRATRIRQFNTNGEQVSGDSEDLVWEDLDSGTVYESGIAIGGKPISGEDGCWRQTEGRQRFEYPSEFHVERRPRLVAEYDRIIEALRTVLNASVRTGNPVRWC